MPALHDQPRTRRGDERLERLGRGDHDDVAARLVRDPEHLVQEASGERLALRVVEDRREACLGGGQARGAAR